MRFFLLLFFILIRCTSAIQTDGPDAFHLRTPPSRGFSPNPTVDVSQPCGPYEPSSDLSDLHQRAQVTLMVKEKQCGLVTLSYRPQSSPPRWILLEEMEVTAGRTHLTFRVDLTNIASPGDRGTLQAIFHPRAINTTFWTRYLDGFDKYNDRSSEEDLIDIALASSLRRGERPNGYERYALSRLYQCADVIIRKGASESDMSSADAPDFKYSTARTAGLALGAVVAMAVVLSI
ncbi:hypothetical protein IWQ60_007449 [Tieghemiomyces parasiticus]|uniref:Uncharacterized protein n=1 Tax=Tieghemiomyces parasiticus TaxID=78921 RepID=A0A9W8DQI4_9FUNG|nr:hypothetical protein IWQ60_007449 [Tieghemiomyces parasiticus]